MSKKDIVKKLTKRQDILEVRLAKATLKFADVFELEIIRSRLEEVDKLLKWAKGF